MGTFIKAQADDQHTFDVYQAKPTQIKAGLILIQEIFGVNTHIQRVADGYAAEGFLVLAPAIFDRQQRNVQLSYVGEDLQRGLELMNSLDWSLLFNDIKATLELLHSLADVKVGMVGFCFGGTTTWRCAHRFDLDAAVCYYGGSIHDFAHESPKCPVLLHFGEKDAYTPAEHVQDIQKMNPKAEVSLYPADHGFNCEERASYDPSSAALAKKRTLEFFNKYLVHQI